MLTFLSKMTVIRRDTHYGHCAFAGTHSRQLPFSPGSQHFGRLAGQMGGGSGLHLNVDPFKSCDKSATFQIGELWAASMPLFVNSGTFSVAFAFICNKVVSKTVARVAFMMSIAITS
jgi:hypothetical protein